MLNLYRDAKVVLAIAGAASAGTTLTGTVDTQDYEGVAFVGSIATQNAGNYAKAGGGAQSNGGDAADLAGTKSIPQNNGDSFLLDVYRPAQRYVTVSVVRGANTVTGDVYAILYGAKKKPTTQGSTMTGVPASGVVVSPALGAP